MQSNSLDELFKSHLKNHDIVPEGIHFNKERIYASLQKKQNDSSPSLRWIKYAVITFILLSSGYCHWHQNRLINNQIGALAQYNNLVDSIKLNSSDQYFAQRIMIDSLRANVIKNNQKEELYPLRSLPIRTIENPIIVVSTSPIIIVDPIYVTQTKLTDSDHKSVSELDLPLYYESERLANNTSNTLKNRSLSQKLNQLINN